MCVLGPLTCLSSPPGHANASFCPHAYGCRTLVVCEGRAVLDVTDSELTVTVRVPEGRWLWLVSSRAGSRLPPVVPLSVALPECVPCLPRPNPGPGARGSSLWGPPGPSREAPEGVQEPRYCPAAPWGPAGQSGLPGEGGVRQKGVDGVPGAWALPHTPQTSVWPQRLASPLSGPQEGPSTWQPGWGPGPGCDIVTASLAARPDPGLWQRSPGVGPCRWAPAPTPDLDPSLGPREGDQALML